MTTFDKREEGFEGKFVYDEKLNFAVEARLSKLYGLWAAEKLGITGADALTYAQEVVSANLDEPGFDDILRKVRADFDKKGLDVSEHVMHAQLEICLEEAKKQIAEQSS